MSPAAVPDGRRHLRLRNPRRADEIGNEIGNDKKDGGSQSRLGGSDNPKSKGSNSMDPIDDITVSYECQYNVTNTGSTVVNVTYVVDDTSIDLGTLEPGASDVFLLDYNSTAGACPSVMVDATEEVSGTADTREEGSCTASESWPPSSDVDVRRKMMRNDFSSTASINEKKIIQNVPNDANSWDI